MANVTVATFNCENLFARFKFKGKRVKQNGKFVFRPWTEKELADIAEKGFDVDMTMFKELTGEMRTLTAQAILGTDADVIALQEVEAMETLKIFNSNHLKKAGYKHQLVIDGNDERMIDVAVLSRLPFAHINTNQYTRTESNRAFVFSRDCLEVIVQVTANKQLPLFVNHLKSMLGGRAQTMARRKVQTEEIVKILKARFGNNPGAQEWIVLGDMNDYMPSKGLEPLLTSGWVVNVNERIADADDRWTHYYDNDDEYQQLDYILLSNALAAKNPNAIPTIERRGMPKRAKRYTGKRFDGVGENNPKASDHCPVSIKLTI